MKVAKKGKLFVLSGPSGVGKGTVCRQLLRISPEVELSVSATTRSPRAGEVEGVNYYFKTREEFQQLIDSGKMLEYAEAYGNFYGTPLDRVLEAIEAGKNIVLEIEMNGAMQVKEKYDEAVLIFLLPPSIKELFHRIETRGTETKEALARREKSAISEIERVKEYHYYVVNDSVEQAARDLQKIITIMSNEIDGDEQIELPIYKVDEDIDKIVTQIKEGKNVKAIN